LTSLKQLGAVTRFSDPKIGYLQMQVSNTRLLDVLDVGGLEYAFTTTDNDYERAMTWGGDKTYIPPAERKVAPVGPIHLPISRVGKTLPEDGPYFAADEAG